MLVYKNKCWSEQGVLDSKQEYVPEDISHTHNNNIKTVSSNSSDDPDVSNKFYQLNFYCILIIQ